MRIDVWADLVCPWCFIGKVRLQEALRDIAMSDEVQIRHRAFQLDPSAHGPSAPTLDHLAAKYGVTRDQALAMMARVTQVAAEEGLHYRLDETMTGNTRDAHRVVLWVQDEHAGLAQPLLNDLYSAYFERGASIFTGEDLVPFVRGLGIDDEAMMRMLVTDDYVDRVAEDQDAARSLGANGVPFFVFDDAIGVSGAQPLEVFRSALEQAIGAR